MKLCGVYMIEHTATGRRYIGKSVDVDHRIAQHFTPNEIKDSNNHIHRAIKKYGKEAFTVRLLEVCRDDVAARAREVALILQHGTVNPAGFNLTLGGDGTAGLRASLESRAKMSASRRGTKRSAETRARMSASQVGRVQTEEARAKVSAANKGNKYCLGHKLSEETKAKISATLAGRVPARNIRPRVQKESEA